MLHTILFVVAIVFVAIGQLLGFGNWSILLGLMPFLLLAVLFYIAFRRVRARRAARR